MENLQKIRILIADSETVIAKKLAFYLQESGFDTKVMNSNYLIQKEILEWRPHFVFIDLMFPGFYAQECLQFLKSKQRLGSNGTRVIVTSSHNDPKNVRACIKNGAHDFLVKPIKSLDVLQRLMLQVRSKEFSDLEPTSSEDPRLKDYFKMLELLIKTTAHKKPTQDIRFELTQMLSIALKAVRTSIIEFKNNKKSLHVICSSDDVNLTDFVLDIKKYPELQYLIRTERPLFVENIAHDATLAKIQKEVQSINFSSMIVLPIHHGPELVAALSVRMPEECSNLSDWDIKIGTLASQLIAITWKFPPPAARQKAS